MTRTACIFIALLSLWGCGVPTDELTLTFRHRLGEPLEGFACQEEASGGGRTTPLFERIDAGRHLHLVLDVIRTRGALPAGTGALLNTCNPRVRNRDASVPTGDERNCVVAPEHRSCVDLNLTLLASRSPNGIPEATFRQLAESGPLAHLDEGGPVMFRLVGTTESPVGCARSYDLMAVNADGDLGELSAPVIDAPVAPPPFAQDKLVGCAFSFPTRLGKRDQEVEIGFDLTFDQDGTCGGHLVGICANGLTPP